MFVRRCVVGFVVVRRLGVCGRRVVWLWWGSDSVVCVCDRWWRRRELVWLLL
jgi:hypothetical protein